MVLISTQSCVWCMQLGRFKPEVAPYMTWTEGHNWSYEGHIRPGTWLFKVSAEQKVITADDQGKLPRV